MGLVQRAKTAVNVFAGSFRGHLTVCIALPFFDALLKCFDFSVL